jgi:hypothetical protein
VSNCAQDASFLVYSRENKQSQEQPQIPFGDDNKDTDKAIAEAAQGKCQSFDCVAHEVP